MAHLWRRIPRTGDKRKMTEVEQLAQEQFNTFRNRFCEMISEIAEEYRSAFIQGYAKGETDEKFRTKQVIKYDYNNEVAKEYTTLQERIAELEKENAELKEEIKKWQDEWQEQVQKANDESYARTLQTIQLNKAKELLKDITSSYGSTEVSEEYMYLKIKRAEQFLGELK